MWLPQHQKRRARTIRVLGLVRNLLAQELHAGCGIPAPGLGVERLAVIGAEPLRQGRPGRLDVVGNALAR